MTLITRLLPILTPNLLNEIGENAEWDDGSHRITQMLTFYVGNPQVLGHDRPRLIRGLHQLFTLFGEFDFSIGGRLLPKKMTFPDPPIPGTYEIVPLRSYQELRDEGKQQSNCVGSPGYALSVVDRNSYVYAVNNPERCTLQIHRDPADGYWKISEIRTSRNGQPSSDTLSAVRAWLSAGNGVIRDKARRQASRTEVPVSPLLRSGHRLEPGR